jgi:major type 1 subunit fimbrin (pilin)
MQQQLKPLRIHLSVTSPTTDLDDTDKTLLVNQAIGTITANPVFIQLSNMNFEPVDLSAPWGKQAKSPIRTSGGRIYLQYFVGLASKTGIVNAQNVQAVVNYTLMYN